MIRSATPGDLDAMIALHWLSWRTHYRAVLPAPYIDVGLGEDLAALWRDRFAADPAPALFLVAEEQGEVVGLAAGLARAGRLYVDNLHVAPALRGRGIGRLLLGELARRARARGLEGAYLEVFDVNTAAMRFYEGLGAVRGERKTEAVFGRHWAAETRFDWATLDRLVLL
jgi:ribosomal protein S18 acetylase RimI-like enzyme